MLMYPMDFEEFCWAMNEDLLAEYIRRCFHDETPLEQALHAKAMMIFRQYILVGGMPRSVAAFLENDRSFVMADMEKRDILNLYREDIMKIKSGYRSNVLAIFDQIPAFLSRSERRVVMSSVEKGGSFPKYHDTFYWLADSMIVNECFNTRDPNVGLSLNEDRTYVKCYMGDTGLLISHTFDKLYFYTKYDNATHRNEIEIDFILSNNSKLKYKIYPIEVKSSEKYTTKSLTRFNEKFHSRIGRSYVIHPRNLKKEADTLCIPAYMSFCL